MKDERSGRNPSEPEQWLEEFGDYLHGYAAYRVSDPSAVEDLVQETLLAGYRGWERFEGRSSVKTWLTTILKRKIIDYYRFRARERERFVPMESTSQYGEDGGEFTTEGRILPQAAAKVWERVPDDAAEQAEFWGVLQGCLDELPEAQRTVFIGREMDGLTTEEITEAEGITPNHLWVILHRARKGLRKCLELKWFKAS